MQAYNIANVKEFMNAILKGDVFDSFEARGVSLQTFTRFDISCICNSTDEGTKIKYCSWIDIKPVVFSLVKGKSLPKLLRIGLCISGDEAEKTISNACALHLTITYDSGVITVLTGSSQKNFTLDNSTDAEWDNFALSLLRKIDAGIMENAG